MKFYQTITTTNRSNDEFVEYQGYDLEKAIQVRDYENGHRLASEKDNYHCEIRVYDIEKPFEDMDDDKQCATLSEYNIYE